MKLAVKFRDENGNIQLEGELTKQEVSFLLQFAVNHLLASGVQFELGKPPTEDESRIVMPEGSTLQ